VTDAADPYDGDAEQTGASSHHIPSIHSSEGPAMTYLRNTAVVFGTATPSPALGAWLITYECPFCRRKHSHPGGPTAHAPQSGPLATKCGRRVELMVRLAGGVQ
jgi:hypothetical protein